MSSNIPIIGQPKFAVHNWVSVINGQCECGEHIQVVGGGATQCPKCGVLWSLAILNWDFRTPTNTNIQLKWQKPVRVENEGNPA